ncbi:MAG: hypothetical protein AAF697_00490 [Pseudomonadota bacterium]
MIKISVDELGELHDSLAALDMALETLDRIGAGIAAIHVDAAIDQLRNNIEIVENRGRTGAPTLSLR